MVRNRSRTELKNIGKKITARLSETGIHTEEALRAAGPVEAHRKIRKNHPDETLPLRYYLYSFEGVYVINIGMQSVRSENVSLNGQLPISVTGCCRVADGRFSQAADRKAQYKKGEIFPDGMVETVGG